MTAAPAAAAPADAPAAALPVIIVFDELAGDITTQLEKD